MSVSGPKDDIPHDGQNGYFSAMRMAAIRIAVLCGWASTVSAQPLPRLAGVDGVSICDRISAYELWNSTSREMTSGDAIAHVYFVDPEAAAGQAIVLIGGYGTGVEPVCLRILPSGETVEVRAGSTSGTFDVEGAHQNFRIAIDANGRVLIGGIVVGQIR